MIDSIVVTAGYHNFGGTALNTTAGDIDGPFLVVGDVYDKFYRRWLT